MLNMDQIAGMSLKSQPLNCSIVLDQLIFCVRFIANFLTIIKWLSGADFDRFNLYIRQYLIQIQRFYLW